MIYPVPAGVTPNSHHCGDCGGRFRMPLKAGGGPRDYVLTCIDDPAHQTYQKKDTGTKFLAHPDGTTREVDIVTQKEVTALAPITDQATALATVNRAMNLGLFPDKDQSADQLALLAQVALAYRLDPLMGEIMPYQGRPYITIAGRRRLDNAAGHFISVRYRPPTTEEESYWLKVGAMKPKDVIQICIGEHMASGAVVEGMGRVLDGEGERLIANSKNIARARERLPLINRQIEMAQKRGERRMREQMFGPVAKPMGLEGIGILHEGDEPNVIEGTARVVEEDNKALAQGDLGACPEHDTTWFVSETNWGAVQASHKIEGTNEWCRFGNVEAVAFRTAYESRFGEYKKPEADTWLKDNFNGKTWSKMEPVQMLRAVTLLATPPTGPEPDTQPPADAEAPELPPDDAEYQQFLAGEAAAQRAEREGA